MTAKPVLVNWRKIFISLIDLEKGEWKAQSCDIACYQVLHIEIPAFRKYALQMVTVTKSSIERGDSLKLFVCAFVVIALGLGSFLLADRCHIPSFAIVLGWVGVGFLANVVRDFRSLLRRPLFLFFFMGWLPVYLVVWAVTWLYLSLTEWAIVMVLQLAVGYWLVHRIFKVPYPWDVARDPRRELGL
jgi:hypothetical protein